VFNIAIFNIVELLFGWLVGLIAGLIKHIFNFFALFEDGQCHLEGSVLKLNDEVNKHLIFVLYKIKLFTNSPKLFSHPISNYCHILQIVHVSTNVCDLFIKQARKPQLTPTCSLFVFVY